MTELQLGPASVLWTGGAELHLGHNPPRSPHDDACCGPEVVARRAAIAPGEWKYLTQVHGNTVVVAASDTKPGLEADAVVTTERGVTLAIATADCGSIALASAEGVAGALHAGWSGLYAGVVGSAVTAMRNLGASKVTAALGPCIHRECYEFSAEMLGKMVARFGTEVASVTSNGKPSFDLPVAIAADLKQWDVELTYVDERCTSCSGEFFSHRTTGTSNRQVMLVRL